jgi:hypothetical protein
MTALLDEDAGLQASATGERVATAQESDSHVCHGLPRCGPTDWALSCGQQRLRGRLDTQG